MLKGPCQSFLDEVLGVGMPVTQPIAKEIQQARSKAIRELGLPQTPVEQAIEKAVLWFRSNGYVR